MNLSEILRRTMDETQTPARVCAAALGLSPQNFGQRLKRGTLSLEQICTAIEACGAIMVVQVTQGGKLLYNGTSVE